MKIEGFDVELQRDASLRAWELHLHNDQGWQELSVRDELIRRHYNMGNVHANPAAYVPLLVTELPSENRILQCALCGEAAYYECPEDVPMRVICRTCADKEDACAVDSYTLRYIYQ